MRKFSYKGWWGTYDQTLHSPKLEGSIQNLADKPVAGGLCGTKTPENLKEGQKKRKKSLTFF